MGLRLKVLEYTKREAKIRTTLVSVEAEYILPGYGVNGSLCGTYKPGRILVPDEWIDG